MNKIRIFRSCVCMLMICCLLTVCVLRPAATGVEVLAGAGVASVPGLNVIAAILLGIGLIYVATTTDWDNVVNNIKTRLTETAHIDENGNITIIKIPDPNGGVPTWMCDVALIEMIRQWLFDDGILTETASDDFYYGNVVAPSFPFDYYPSSLVVSFPETGNVKSYLLENEYFYLYYSESEGVTYITEDRNITALQGRALVLQDGSWVTEEGIYSTYYYPILDLTSSGKYTYEFSIQFMSTSGNINSPIPVTDVSTSLDLTLGQVAPSSTELATGYPEWAAGVQTITGTDVGSDEEYVTAYPLALGQTLDETLAQTQTQAWSGVSTYVDTTTDTGTDTETDTETNTGTSTDVWTPPSNPGDFTLDLSKFFPFCIPFDLYAFLTCLNADPVAPVIQWEIYLPGGGSYPLELDLSPFDSVAQLLRRLQLLLFVIALAMKTRDLIKG